MPKSLMTFVKLSFLVVCSLLVAGCRYHKKIKIFPEYCLKEQEAQLCDIPLMVTARPLHVAGAQDKHECHGYGASYVLYEPYAIIIAFYSREMEIYGWQLMEHFEANGEHLLIFEKPHTKCVISLRPHIDGQTSLFIFIK